MKRIFIPILALTVGFATQAYAQNGAASDDAPSAARVLAGVREYPEPVIAALVTLANNPEWLDKAVTKIRANQDPLAGADASMPEPVRAALKSLASTPEAIMLAAARREELNLLRDMRQEAPQGADVKVRQLRTDYATAKREGALRWQEALQSNEEALNAYRELLTKFTQELRKQVPNFAAVEVTDKSYYLVCPPDDVLMGFGQEKKAPEVLWKLMTEWYDRYGAEPMDEQLLRGVGGIGPSRAENALIDGPADRRASMFRADDGKRAAAIGLVPVALQPLADQPVEARAAFAIAEHERLWARLPAAQQGQDVAMGDDGAGYDGADMKIEPPQETQPGAANADVVVTPARPDMIIPPGASKRWSNEQPVVIASGYDDVIDTQGGEVQVVDGGTQVVVESAPAVVYEDYAPVYVTRPYYSYYPYYGGYCYPSWSFGFGFGYSNCYPYSYYRSCYPYSYGYGGYCGYRPYGYYHGYGGGYYHGHNGYYGYNRGGYGRYYDRPRATPYRNGNYADGRGYSSNRLYNGRNYAGAADQRGNAIRGGGLSQGQRFANGSQALRGGDGRGRSGVGADGSRISPRSISPRSGGDGIARGGDVGGIGRSGGGDGVRRSQPSMRSGSPQGIQQGGTRSLGAPRSSGGMSPRSSGSIGSLRGRSAQTMPAPRSSFNRSSVFRGGGGMSRPSMSGGGGSRSIQRSGGGFGGGGGGRRGR